MSNSVTIAHVSLDIEHMQERVSGALSVQQLIHVSSDPVFGTN